MKSVSPVVPGADLPEVIFGADQPPYTPLQMFKYYNDPDGTVLCRWHMTWRERLSVLLRGDVYLYVNTFGQPLQPVALQVEKPVMK